MPSELPSDRADHQNNPETTTNQVSLFHLLLAIAFCMPVVSVTTELKHAGRGWLHYLVAVPTALAFGACIVAADSNLGRAVWLRTQRYSKRVQNAFAIFWFVVQPGWICCGYIFGLKLAAFVAAHIYADLS